MPRGTPLYDAGPSKPTAKRKKLSDEVLKERSERKAKMADMIDEVMNEIYEVLHQKIDDAVERTGKNHWHFWTLLGQHGREMNKKRSASGWNGFLREKVAEMNLGE
jgi:hypothetical protein